MTKSTADARALPTRTCIDFCYTESAMMTARMTGAACPFAHDAHWTTSSSLWTLNSDKKGEVLVSEP